MSDQRDTKAAANWTLNDSWENLDLGMIDITTMEAVDIPKKKKIELPAPSMEGARIDNSDVYHGARSMKIGKTKPNTEALDRWLEQQGRMGNGARTFWVVFGMVCVIVLLLSFMAGNAHAGAAVMQFTVIDVTTETVTVEDAHGDSFTFYREGTIDVVVGQDVNVMTDFTYKGNGLWAWHSQLTAIIE